MTTWDITTEGQGSTSRLNTARMQQGSTGNVDRLLTEHRAASSAVSHNDMMLSVYEERALKHEAELEAVRAKGEPVAEIDPEELAARIFNRIHAPWL
ncbi:hypothetical protein AW27_015075 [Streptomyces sp. PCS3-D2]|uniref:hypothetical protein n=1 Tax=Streptomyces sp. PCS3-D2 TaxID=1460244 RepID=UPI000449C3BB|nr:hypothetical protein [Streptomyces sp. PCS3-D2]WKV72735.1 hypothetical protein AW27_015075 [Streptomyces sp. PCS3-D2]